MAPISLGLDTAHHRVPTIYGIDFGRRRDAKSSHDAAKKEFIILDSYILLGLVLGPPQEFRCMLLVSETITEECQ